MGAPIWRWVATSHSRTVIVVARLAMILLWGLNATAYRFTRPRDHGRADLAVGGHVPQSRGVIVASAVAKILPLGLNATAIARRVPAIMGAPIWRWVATSTAARCRPSSRWPGRCRRG